jgi:diaminopimelate decarboxylase
VRCENPHLINSYSGYMSAHPAGPRHGDSPPIHAAPTRPDRVSDIYALDPQVWPSGLTRGEDGALRLAGVDVRDAVTVGESPVFLLDEEHTRNSARAYAEAYERAAQGTDVYYAGKAFLATTVVRWLVEEGLRIDVCTMGELEIALRADVDPGLILFHGNNKSLTEIGRALDVGVGRFVIDSMQELARIAMLAADRDRVADVLIRVTVGVEAHTHEFIATAHEDQKFGLAMADGTALEAARRAHELPALNLLGLHSHIGSQIFDPAGFEVAARRLVALMSELADLGDGVSILIPELNLGGGMGIAYTAEDAPLEVNAMAMAIADTVGRSCLEAGLSQPRLAVEPGRAIIGAAGVTIYTVGTTKSVELDSGQHRTYVSVDGGMSDNIRTALYDAEYSVTLANRVSEADLMLVRIVGKHCESGDIVVRDAWLPDDLCPGDLLAVAGTGAYCRSMASNYNQLPRPAVLSAKNEHLQTILRRETLDDLLALDPGA